MKTKLSILLIISILSAVILSGCGKNSDSITDIINFNDFTEAEETEADTEEETEEKTTSYEQESVEPDELRYYYSTFNDEQQTLYENALEYMENSLHNFKIRTDDFDNVEKAIFAFVYDYPEYYWLRSGYHSSGSGNLYTITIDTVPGYENGPTDTDRNAFNAKVDRIINEAEAYSSDYEKIIFIYDWLRENVTYNSDITESNSGDRSAEEQECYTAYGAIVNGSAVCEGYAKAFELFMHKLGYKCAMISGEGDGTEHAWNAVEVNGEYYYCDPTWDDKEGEITDVPSYDYFCITEDMMNRDHTPDSAYEYPDADSSDMTYFEHNGYVIDYYSYDAVTELIRAQEGNEWIYISFKNKDDFNEAEYEIKSITQYAMQLNGAGTCNYMSNDSQYVIMIKI